MSGMIAMWAGSKDSIPAGWLECDGSLVDQGQFPDLYTAISDNFGASPPTNQFYLPDLRGRFVRGVDDGANRDPDVNSRQDMQNAALVSTTVGSVQSHAFQNHDHGYTITQTASDIADSAGIKNGHDYETTSASTDVAASGSYSVSTETRPINAYLYFIIQT